MTLWGLLAFAIRLGLGLLIGPFADIIMCPIIGIFVGIPGIIGCALAEFLIEFITHLGPIAAICYSMSPVLIGFIMLFSKRFLKNKNRIKDTWIYFAFISIAGVICAIVSESLTLLSVWNELTRDLLIDGIMGFICVGISISYPIYFLISGIRERSLKNGNSLINIFACWIPVQTVMVFLFKARAYQIETNNFKACLWEILNDWVSINALIVATVLLVLIIITLVSKYKRIMLFIFAGTMTLASVFNIVTFDSGEGTYLLIFMAVWLLIHAIFFNWYENTALKVKTVKIIKWILHVVLIGVLILFNALWISAHSVPKAIGCENHVIVLGAPVIYDEATEILEDRISVASDFLEFNEDAFSILTGGTKVEGGKTEAEVMRDGIIANGISEDRLILETEAKTTEENFSKSMEIIKDRGGSAEEELVIVTSSFHILRAAIYANKAGFRDIYTKGADSFVFKDWAWYLRESFTILPLIFGK